MLSLDETKQFLRVDGNEEDMLITSLIFTSKELVENTLRKKLSDFEDLPETIRQAMLIVVASLYEERQVSKGKEGTSVVDMLELVRLMLFAYREDKF